MQGLSNRSLFGNSQSICERSTTQNVGWAFEFHFRKTAQIQECAEAQKPLPEGTGKTNCSTDFLNQDFSL